MQLVLDVLADRPRSADDAEWLAALALADQEHVLPSCLQRLRDDRWEVSPAVAARIEVARRDNALAAFFWKNELRGLLQAFAQGAVEVVLLKGPSLAERVYGDASLRVCRDLDLLVRPCDAATASVILRQCGFIADPYASSYEHSWRRASTLVELHTDVEDPLAFDFDIAGAWNRSHAAHFTDQTARVLDHADELLMLCLHGVRHRFERLSHVLDVAMAFRTFGPPPPGSRLPHVLALGQAMAAKLHPAVVSAIANAPLQALCDGLWADLLAAPAAPMDWKRQHAFFLQLEPSSRHRVYARVRHLCILSTRLVPDDFAFARTMGVSHRYLVWMLRPFRLLFRSRS